MKRTLILCGLASLLSSCDLSENPSRAAQRFPGFTQVGDDGGSANLHIDVTSIKREQGSVRVKILEEIHDGYVIQDANTNCQDTFYTMDAIHYSNDGITETNYPGRTHLIDQEPAIGALVRKVCAGIVMPRIEKPKAAAVPNRSSAPINHSDADNGVPQGAATAATPLPIDTPDTLQTRLGLLAVTRSGNGPQLTLRGRVIFMGESDHLTLYRLFSLPDYDVVLFGSDCSGSSCGVVDLGLLLLREGANPTVIMDKDFHAYPPNVIVAMHRSVLKLDLGFSEQKRKLAEFDGEHLRVWREHASSKALDEGLCGSLYLNVFPNCLNRREQPSDCSDPQSNFSSAQNRAVGAATDYPGFVRSAFDQQCEFACSKGQLTDYTTFGNVVCSKTMESRVP